MKATKMSKPNEGVRCEVNTCHYYTQGDHCTANKIEIAPRNANSATETDCETFSTQP
jgi:hypothetical protein